jgi:hypothetical protein
MGIVHRRLCCVLHYQCHFGGEIPTIESRMDVHRNVCKICNTVDPSKGKCDDSKFVVEEKHWEGGKNRKRIHYVIGMKLDKRASNVTGGAYASCYQR